jgi:hypothetical protein
MVPLAAEIAAKCPTFVAIARGIGVHEETIRNWMRKGEQEESDSLHAQFFAAISAALLEGEKYLSLKLFNGDSKDAAWILTHSPFFRDEWSDAAAERRAVQRSQDRTIAVLEAAPELTNEQRRMLFARLAAAGEHPDPGSLE